jgi:hypothetical protein
MVETLAVLFFSRSAIMIGPPMKGLPFVLLFTAMTFFSWGAYGPVLHHGAIAFDHDSLRAFVGVGLAYFLIAVLIPLAILKKNGETGRWTVLGAVYSLVAGAVGAVGALGIILALGYGGRTVYVMPLVFGFAPIVNTLVTAFLTRTFHQIRPVFVGGVVTAALGAAGVLYFKPTPPPSPPIVETSPTAALPLKLVAQNNSASDTAAGAIADADQPTTSDSHEGSYDGQTHAAGAAPLPSAGGAPLKTSLPGIVLSIVTAALCWGSYGPVLHVGQSKMQGSRLRPFTCVGLAYFIIAVLVPLVLISARSADPGSWNVTGMIWSILAGAAGAIGALGVILAFNAGGKPYYVMPLIFGFAPVINTFISLSESGTWNLVSPMFWVSLGVVIGGAVTVLTNAPRPARGK